MTQQMLEIGRTEMPRQREREEYAARLRDAGIRPPTRYNVTPEDLAPPIAKTPALFAFVIRILRSFR